MISIVREGRVRLRAEAIGQAWRMSRVASLEGAWIPIDVWRMQQMEKAVKPVLHDALSYEMTAF